MLHIFAAMHILILISKQVHEPLETREFHFHRLGVDKREGESVEGEPLLLCSGEQNKVTTND